MLIAAVLSLVLILFFCSFSNRLDQGLIGIADLVTCVLSIGLIWAVVAIFVTMFNRIRGDGKESLSAVISKIVASLFIGAFCLLTLIYGEFSKTITFNGDSFLSLVNEWLPYVGYYILVGIDASSSSSSRSLSKWSLDFNYEEFKKYLSAYWGYGKVVIIVITIYYIERFIHLYRLSKNTYKMFRSYVGIINKYFIKGKPIKDHRVKAFVVDNELTNPLEPELWNKNAAKYFTERIQ